MTDHPTERKLCHGVFVVCLLLNLAFSAIGFTKSLQELHLFRQIQTATTARYLQEDGFSLAYPTPVFGPPWSVPMEFPIYQECVALVGKTTGLPLEPTGRLIALLFLYLALPAIYGAAELLRLSAARRWLLLGLVLLSPLYIYYSRAFMIESTALCMAAWFLHAYSRGLLRASSRWLAMAAIFGVAAALAKITTFIVFLSVAAAFTIHLLWSQWRNLPERKKLVRTVTRGLAATIPAVAIGVLWVRFSDHVKAGNPFSAQLMSSNMTPFNFGTLEQRLSSLFWHNIYSHITIGIAPAINLALVVFVGLVLGREYRARTLLLLLGFFTGPLIFSNLYFVHDYYFYACGVFLLGALTLAWSQVLDLQMFSTWSRRAVVALSIGFQIWTYTQFYLGAQLKPDSGPPELSTILATTTAPDDVVVYFGRDWDLQVSFYAHRRAVMVTDFMDHKPAIIRKVFQRLKPGQVGAMVVTGELRKTPAIFEQFTAELGLDPTPIYVSGDTVVYLRQLNITNTIARLDPKRLKSFSLADVSAVDHGVRMLRRRTYASAITDQGIFSMMSPQPAMVMHPFPLNVHEENGALAFDAHAPTDLIFTVPNGAKTAQAAFGMNAASYRKENHTDGVEFRVEWIPAGGAAPQTLASKYLSPTDQPDDRGVKHFSVTLPSGGGQVWFRTLPGPTGSIACAWGYWSSIKLE